MSREKDRYWKERLDQKRSASTILPPAGDPRDEEETSVEAPEVPELALVPSVPAQAPVSPPTGPQLVGWAVVRDRHVPLGGQVAFVRKGKVVPLASVGYLKLLRDAEVELEPVYDA